MSLFVKQSISACLLPILTPLKSKYDSPGLKALSEISTKKAFSRFCFLLVLLKEECRVQCKTRGPVLTTHSQLSTSLEVHRALQKQGENVWKYPEEENVWVGEDNSVTEDCHTKYSSTNLCLHFLHSLLFAQELCHFCHSILFTVKILQPPGGRCEWC